MMIPASLSLTWGAALAASFLALAATAWGSSAAAGCDCSGISKCVASGNMKGGICLAGTHCACCEVGILAATCACRTFDPMEKKNIPAGTSCFDI